MKCDVFWKRIVTLCLTFWLGVFVQNFFALKELPQIDVIPATENENLLPGSKQIICSAADKSLKYEYLIYLDGEETLISVEENEKKIANLTSKEKKATPIKTQRNRKNNAEIKPQLYKPSEHQAEYRILLHKENCYELNGRK
jgi:hypothetical protein